MVEKLRSGKMHVSEWLVEVENKNQCSKKLLNLKKMKTMLGSHDNMYTTKNIYIENVRKHQEKTYSVV